MKSAPMTSMVSVSESAAPRLLTRLGPIQLQPGETLLAALLRQGYPIEYQCRSGFCGACRVRLSGPTDRQVVHWQQAPLALVQEDEILACCCSLKADLTL